MLYIYTVNKNKMNTEAIIKKLENEFKSYLNTEARINNARNENVIAITCDDFETTRNKSSFIKEMIKKQHNQIDMACQSFNITIGDFLSLLEIYEFKIKTK